MSLSNNKNKMKKILLLVIIISIVMIVLILIFGLLFDSSEEERPSINIEKIEGNGSSLETISKIENPEEYTWEEFEKLSPEEQSNFIESFDNPESFDEWFAENGENEILLYPWDIEGKLPEEYTWEEYEKLNEVEKKAFKESFLTEEQFNLWKDSVFGIGERPWEDENKDISEYTWEEFEDLTPAQQEEFLSSFDTPEALEKWLNNA